MMKKLLGKPLLIVLAVLSVIMLQIGTIFLMLALLPTLVAYYIDHEKDRPRFKIVGACNLAAALPYITPMINTTIHLKHYDAIYVIMDPGAWLFIYCGAALGWSLIFLCRMVARFIVSILYQYNIASLESLQQDLLKEWGQQIAQVQEAASN